MNNIHYGQCQFLILFLNLPHVCTSPVAQFKFKSGHFGVPICVLHLGAVSSAIHCAVRCMTVQHCSTFNFKSTDNFCGIHTKKQHTCRSTINTENKNTTFYVLQKFGHVTSPLLGATSTIQNRFESTSSNVLALAERGSPPEKTPLDERVTVSISAKAQSHPPSSKNILIACLSKFGGGQFVLMDLRSRSLSKYTAFPNYIAVSCVRYSYHTKRLIVAVRFPTEIRSYRLNKNGFTSITRYINAEDMDVDDQLNILFVLKANHPFSVRRISLSTKVYSRIISRRIRSVCIVVSPSTKSVFVLEMTSKEESNIFSVNYEGKQYREVVSKRHASAFDVDLDKNILFYHDNLIMYSISLNTLSTKSISILSSYPLDMLYENDVVYVFNGEGGNRTMDIISLSGLKAKASISVTTNTAPTAKICLLPRVNTNRLQ